MKIVFTLFLFLLPFTLPAQCIDELLLRPYGQCSHVYDPVCGCDGVTYRNSCYAELYGALTKWENGICGKIDIFFKPNPVDVQLDLTVRLRVAGYANIIIMDVFGVQYYNSYLTNTYLRHLNIDVNNFPLGVYLLIAQTEDEVVVRRFVKR
jgi:hypothetical protein